MALVSVCKVIGDHSAKLLAANANFVIKQMEHVRHVFLGTMVLIVVKIALPDVLTVTFNLVSVLTVLQDFLAVC